MRNVTVSLDDQSYKAARVAAAEQGKSLSAYLRDLIRLVSPANPNKSAVKRSFDAMDQVRGFRAGNRFTRDELYDR